MRQQPSPDAAVTGSLNASLGGGIAAIAAVAVLTGVTALAAVGGLRHAIAERDAAADIARSLNDLRYAMVNQETGLRGALLTAQDASLGPYRDGRAAYARIDAHLRAIVAPGSAEAARLAEGEAAAHAWQRMIGEPAVRAMAAPATRPAALQLEASGEGRHYFDQLRAALDAASDAARARRRLWDARLGRAAALVAGAIGVGIVVTLAICAAVALAIRRAVTRPLSALADAMRRLASRDLAVAVPGTARRSEVGAMARAVEVFKRGLVELERTSVLRATADTLPALVGYVDAARRIRFLNGEFGRACGLQQDVAVLGGARLADVFAPGQFPGLDAGELDRAFAGEERRFEHRLVRPGAAEERHYEAFFRPHRAEGGELLGVVTLLTDITERRRLAGLLALQAADLARSNEELEQFAYVASHDLKAPLRGIENLLTWIEEDLGALVLGGVRTNMDLARSRVRRLDSLLDDLLAYSRAGRIEAPGTRGGDEPVDTGALVTELASLVSPPPGFRIAPDPAMPTILTPRAPLIQVLQNLIGNAIKHHDHPAQGHVWVRAARCGGETAFTVEDDGPGVPPQFRERVFGMFQTLRPRDEVEGSGMGLAIVRKLIERRGGTVVLADRGAAPDARETDPARPGARGLAVHFTWPDQESPTLQREQS